VAHMVRKVEEILEDGGQDEEVVCHIRGHTEADQGGLEEGLHDGEKVEEGRCGSGREGLEARMVLSQT
jgi:hypothetical protein